MHAYYDEQEPITPFGVVTAMVLEITRHEPRAKRIAQLKASLLRLVQPGQRTVIVARAGYLSPVRTFVFDVDRINGYDVGITEAVSCEQLPATFPREPQHATIDVAEIDGEVA